MKKITTLYNKNLEQLGLVINQINPQNQWVLDGEAIPTRKYDGTACAVIDGLLYKRYDVKKGREAPDGAIPCQDADEITGHHPHWLLCRRIEASDKYFFEGFNSLADLGKVQDGTYELIGEKVQGNPEKIKGHNLVMHGISILDLPALEFEAIKRYLANPENDIEGIVFHHKTDGRMCKLRKSDFGVKRNPKREKSTNN